MKTWSSIVLLLALGCASAVATPAPQTTPNTHATPADRAALQQQMAQLQKRMDKLAKRMGKLSSRLAIDSPSTTVYTFMAHPDRGVLGVVLYPEPQQHGFLVAAVTPDEPAQTAGVRVGDIITHVNGDPVTVHAKGANPTPLGSIKAGTSYKLGLLRDGKPLIITVKASQPKSLGLPIAALARLNAATLTQKDVGKALNKATRELKRSLHAADPTFHFQQPGDAQHAASTLAGLLAHWGIASRWWGLNLARLNGDLSRYFGTDQGALVLTTQSKRYPGLKAGDVITAVNGQLVAEPTDVMRILRSTAPGATVHATVLRHHKPMTIALKAPTADQLWPRSPASVTKSLSFTIRTPTHA